MTASPEPTHFLGKLFAKLAPKIGAQVLFEPEWGGVVGQIRFANGRYRYFRHSSIDLNPLGAAEVAKDKGFAQFFLAEFGYPVIKGKTFFRQDWALTIGSSRDHGAAWMYAEQIGLPVIVKPNGGSRGTAVSLVRNEVEFNRALKASFEVDRVALVQEWQAGDDYRIVVVDDKVISAYQRRPLRVFGDGLSSIATLLEKKQRDFESTKRDTRISFDDPRIDEMLMAQGLSRASVIPCNVEVYLLPNANLSSGGDASDVTRRIHQSYKDMAIAVTKEMGLRLCGVDVLVRGDIEGPLSDYSILEINAAPGLDHYAAVGPDQQLAVEEMYLELLKAMSNY